ncbi:MAG: FAD-dependent oxidoreductase [Nocardioidaceae bacterium]
MIMRAGLLAGDLLRWSAGTSGDLLPPARQISAAHALALAPALRRDGLRSAMLGWDGQLVDDARLVLTIARSAARFGAQIRTRARFTGIEGGVVVLKDELSGQTHPDHGPRGDQCGESGRARSPSSFRLPRHQSSSSPAGAATWC